MTGGIDEVTETGIVDADGRHHEVDTIIFGTGFQVTDPPISHRLHGRGGERLADSWQGSPRAHLGMGVAGFPNLFLLLGPSTGLGHNSVLLMIEAQISYLRQVLRYRREHRLATLEPTPEVRPPTWLVSTPRTTRSRRPRRRPPASPRSSENQERKR